MLPSGPEVGKEKHPMHSRLAPPLGCMSSLSLGSGTAAAAGAGVCVKWSWPPAVPFSSI